MICLYKQMLHICNLQRDNIYSKIYQYFTFPVASGYRYPSGQKNLLYHSAQFHKNNKNYFVSVVQESGSVISYPDSDVTLEVTHSGRTVIMQHSHTNFESVRHAIPQKECLISPLAQFHTIEQVRAEELESHRYRYKVTIPHCLSRIHNLSCVTVRLGDITRPHSLRILRKGSPVKEKLPCYKVDRKSITIYCNHFCDVVCTSTQKVCTSKILALPFGRIGPDCSGMQTHMKVKTYVCSFLYSDKNLKLVNIFYFIRVKSVN